MYGLFTSLATFVALASTATASSMFVKRDSWGPSVGMGPSTQQIVSTTTTVYPGEMPPDQAGYLFVWMGISNGTGDLIQSIIGSYPKGLSECGGPDADTTWFVHFLCSEHGQHAHEPTGASLLKFSAMMRKESQTNGWEV